MKKSPSPGLPLRRIKTLSTTLHHQQQQRHIHNTSRRSSEVVVSPTPSGVFTSSSTSSPRSLRRGPSTTDFSGASGRPRFISSSNPRGERAGTTEAHPEDDDRRRWSETYDQSTQRGASTSGQVAEINKKNEAQKQNALYGVLNCYILNCYTDSPCKIAIGLHLIKVLSMTNFRRAKQHDDL